MFERMAGSLMSGSSQRGSRSGGRITGMRSWMGRTRSLGVVVMMVHDWRRSPSGSRQVSQRPAKAKGSPDWRVIRMGRRALPSRCHS